jgi:WD40 repeat protein
MSLASAVFLLGVVNYGQISPPITAIAVTPDSKSIVVGSQSGVRLVSVETRSTIGKLTTNLSHVHDLVFSPHGERLAVAGGSPAELGAVEILDWGTKCRQFRFATHGDIVYSTCWIDDESFVSAGGDDNLYLHRFGAESLKLGSHSKRVRDVTLVGGKAMIASCGMDQRIRVWTLDGELVRTLDNHTQAVNSLSALATDGLPVMASCGQDRTIRFWQPTIGRMMRFARTSIEPLDCAWLPDRKSLAAVCGNGALVVVDSETAQITIDRPVVTGAAYAVAVSPDGRFLAIGGEAGQIATVPLIEIGTRDTHR